MADGKDTKDKKAASADSNQAPASGDQAAAPTRVTKKRERVTKKVTNELPPVAELKPGESIEGFYTGAREIKAAGSIFFTHVIQNEETGELNSLSGAMIDRLLFCVPRGEWCRLTYNGKERTQRGFNMKAFELEVEEKTKLLSEADALALQKSLRTHSAED